MERLCHRIICLLVGLLLCILPPTIFAQQFDNFSTQKPFLIRGNFTTNLIGYEVQGIDSRMDPFGMMLSANATASIYGFSMPFSFRYSNRQLDYTQPFNQFGLSPSYKWAKAHIGYRSISFSNFTLAGHSFLGGGVELTPGLLRFGFVYGRFKKSAVAFEQAIDTTQTLTRHGFGAKIGLGTERTFVDLILLRISDDSTSVVKSNPGEYLPSEANTVAGINTRISFSRQLSFESEIAASIYTDDVAAPGLNLSGNFIQKSGEWLHVNQSTELLTAVKAGINYRLPGFSTRLEYRRIDPGYRSMGAYFMNNDIENFTIAPSLSLLKRKLNIRGSIGLQRDNLRSTKRATSLRTISSAQLSYNPAPLFGIDISYSNYSSNQRAGRVPLIDSLKLFQTNSNFTIAPRMMITGSHYNHMIIAMLSRMQLFDRNINTKNYTENQATLLNLNYSLNILKIQANVLAGVNYNLLENFAGEQQALGFTLGIQKAFMQGKVNAGINNSTIRMNYPQGAGWVINTSLNTGFQLARKHAVRFNLFYIRSAFPNGLVAGSFNEIKGDMSYVYTF